MTPNRKTQKTEIGLGAGAGISAAAKPVTRCFIKKLEVADDLWHRIRDKPVAISLRYEEVLEIIEALEQKETPPERG